jgi:protein-disulfide isomerase
VSGAPAFFVNDWFISGAQPFAVFQETIEKALQGQHPPPTPTPLPSGATIFDPNPERPGYTYGGDAFCGSEKAEIGLVEFVDFQSAENRKHFLEEWPELEKTYVGPGKVRLVVKHFPALEHTQGITAAEAAECAGQQGAFCSMYDLLFTKQEEWSQADDVSAQLKKYAAELDLDAAAFATCLDEGQTSEKVMQDFAIGQDNQFPPAPLFFIFKGEQGGYVSTDQLKEAIEQLLAQ